MIKHITTRLYHKFFLKNKKICEILKTYDIIIPVQFIIKEGKERGYNQSALIAKEFSKNINELEYEDILIKKKKNTIAQSTLNKEERLKMPSICIK